MFSPPSKLDVLWKAVNTHFLNKYRKKGFGVCKTVSYVHTVTKYTGSLCFKFEGQRLYINTKGRHCLDVHMLRVNSTHLASGGMQQARGSGDEPGLGVGGPLSAMPSQQRELSHSIFTDKLLG
jgi:hypothetical protein